MNELPLVSIIIATHNVRRTIRHHLETVLAQNYPKDRLEVVVVDDGSTDGTLDIIRTYPVKLFVVDRCPEGTAENFAVSRASGEIILFTNPDIYLPQNTVLSHAALHKAGIGVLGGKVVWLGDILSFVWNFVTPLDLREVAAIGFANASIRKEILLHVGGIRGLMSYPDVELFMRVRLAGYKVHRVGSITVYHDHPLEVLKHLLIRSFIDEFNHELLRRIYSPLFKQRGIPLTPRRGKVIRIKNFIASLPFFEVVSVLRTSKQVYDSYMPYARRAGIDVSFTKFLLLRFLRGVAMSLGALQAWRIKRPSLRDLLDSHRALRLRKQTAPAKIRVRVS